jgi:AcrR family transcriptional regulator
VSTKKPARGAAPKASAGRVKQRQRTRRDLLATAARLIEQGRLPTVGEVADAATVSRRTAYRYFPTQAKLFVEAALEGLRPAVERAIGAAPSGAGAGDTETRVDALVTAMQRLAADNEHLLRMMIHLTVLEPASGKTPRRGVRRIDWIESTLQPLRGQLAEPAYQRLVSALAVCAGIEALIVLRDIRGLSTQQALDTSRWMARAVLRQVAADLRTARRQS